MQEFISTGCSTQNFPYLRQEAPLLNDEIGLTGALTRDSKSILFINLQSNIQFGGTTSAYFTVKAQHKSQNLPQNVEQVRLCHILLFWRKHHSAVPFIFPSFGSHSICFVGTSFSLGVGIFMLIPPIQPSLVSATLATLPVTGIAPRRIGSCSCQLLPAI